MKKTINYKVEKEEWVKAQDEAFKKISSKLKVDGFRPGKAPRNLVEKNYPGRIMREACDMLIDKEYRRLLLDEKIMPILEPSIDIVKLSSSCLEVNFTFILEPEVKLGKYTDLGVKKENVKVSDSEVNERIDMLLKDYAELVVKEDGASIQNGDVAIIDFKGSKDGVFFDGGTASNYSLEVGSHTFIPGFEEGVIGMKKGEEKDLKLRFPKDYSVSDLADADVNFHVVVNEIKSKVIPKLDKEFFLDLGMDDVKNEDDLRKKMKDEIKEMKEREAMRKYHDDLLEKASSNMEISLDDELVLAEANAMYKDLIDNMALRGIKEDMYLQYANTTKEDILSHMKEDAVKRLKNSYLLDAIIKKEKVKVTSKEIDEEVSKIAKQYHMTVDDVRHEIGGERQIEHEVQVRKALAIMAGEK